MKKRILLIIISLSFILFPLSQISHAANLILDNTPTQVYFSPRGGFTEAIIRQVNNAKSEILVQASSSTSAPMAKALLNTHKRGVTVEAILDKRQRNERYTSATFQANSGIPTYIDDRHAIARNKVMVIDRETLITGSFNFTKAAEEKMRRIC